MAKRQVVSYNYTCDVCEDTIPESDGDSATRKFSWEGSDYVVDVCSTHASQLDGILADLKGFVSAGQRSSGRRGRRPGTAALTTAPRAPRGRRGGTSAAAGTGPKRGDLGIVRAWARENGHSVSERGRIPAALLEAYDAANSTSAPVAETPEASDDAVEATTTATPRKARGRRASATSSASTTTKRSDLGAVRAWARENGHSVSERGRIPAALLTAYDAAHGGSESTEEPAAAAPARKRAARKSAPARKRAARKAAAPAAAS